MKKLLMALAMVVFASGMASAEYPDKPINMIMAFSAGGSSDVQARVMQKYWNKYSNVQWNFLYKTGAGGAIGFGEIAKARPDGYTIGGINTPHMLIQPLTQHAQFTVDDFSYLCKVVDDPNVIAVAKGSKFKSIKELFEFAKQNPGKLKVGMIGPNSGHQLAYFKICEKYDFPVTTVFYKGIEQNTALLGGEVDMIIGNLNDVMRSLDQMDILAIFAEKRHSFLPDTPTMIECGYNVTNRITRGFVAPKKLGKKQIEYLRSVFDKIGADPDYVKDMIKIGQPHEYVSGEPWEKLVREENAEVEGLLKKFGKIK